MYCTGRSGACGTVCINVIATICISSPEMRHKVNPFFVQCVAYNKCKSCTTWCKIDSTVQYLLKKLNSKPSC